MNRFDAQRLPWFAWGILAWFVLDVVLDLDISIIPILIAAFFLTGIVGGRGSRSQGVPPSSSGPPVTPAPDRSGHGGAQPGSPPQDYPGQVPEQGPPPGGPLPRIEVPTYPGPGGAAYPTASSSPTTDPVVSLGQLHLDRLARELDQASSSGDRAEVARTLQELIDLSTRTLQLVDGAGGGPGSGRREFGAGLRRLHREAIAARGEDPPGARVAAVVRGARAMGQTGRYE